MRFESKNKGEIQTNPTPPIDVMTGEPAVPTGGVLYEGDRSYLVYRAHFVDVAATKDPSNRIPVQDPENPGKQLFRKGDHGPYKVWHKPTKIVEKEFVLRANQHAGEQRVDWDFDRSNVVTAANVSPEQVIAKQLVEEAGEQNIEIEELAASIRKRMKSGSKAKAR